MRDVRRQTYVVVSPWDKEYLDTKRVKSGARHLSDRDAEAAKWISGKYGVTVINVILDYPDHLNRPRVQVILDRESEEDTFYDGPDFSARIQKEISAAAANPWIARRADGP
jgi:hypothetical protein